jgi:predicted glycoside hydrolase/deacetylase ChbG (UPF0249 family)
MARLAYPLQPYVLHKRCELMKYLIVNGDDFGASRGINRGIIEAHRYGILTSTSLMVNRPWSEEAALLSRAVPDLSVGLHIHLMSEGKNPTADHNGSCRAELHRQFSGFQELMGRPPTHLDSHHNIHRDPRLLPHFLDLARQYGLPLREHSPARYFSKFYGRWGGETHLEQISVEILMWMLKTEIREGITELSCHPGCVDPDFRSCYSGERESELQTLCDPIIRQVLEEQHIQLVSFRDLVGLLPSLPS